LTASDGECYFFAAVERLGWQRELRRGAKLLQAGARDDARDCFARARALAPERGEPCLALGREEWRRGRLGEAEELLRRACALRPGWPLAQASLARVLVERGALPEADELLARALAESPNDAALLAVEGELHLEADRPDRASDSFHAARAAGASARVVDAGLARAENARGLELAERDRSDEAAFAFKRAGDLDPRWAPPRVNLGALLHRLGRRSAARTQLTKAIALDPRNGLAHYNLGLLCRDDGDLRGAERAFSDALAADPPHPGARQELALACADRGDLDRAIALLEEELRESRRPDASVYVNLGIAHARRGDGSAAEAALRQALRLRPRHARALELLRTLRKLGNFGPLEASNE
jgi:Flp pilus assembly protein TadD